MILPLIFATSVAAKVGNEKSPARVVVTIKLDKVETIFMKISSMILYKIQGYQLFKSSQI